MSDIVHKGPVADPSDAPRPRFPRLPLYTAIVMVGFVLALALFGRLTDIGTVRAEFGEPVAIRDFVIHKASGTAKVVDVRTGELIAEFNNEGFVFGVIRGMERIRLTREIANDQPYRLIKWQNGWVSLSDTVTGERVYLNAFGPDNVAAFERFLHEQRS